MAASRPTARGDSQGGLTLDPALDLAPDLALESALDPVLELDDDSAPPARPTSAPDLDLTTVPGQGRTHRAEIRETGSFTRAVCTDCGWSGPARRARSVATVDLEQHRPPRI